MSTERAPINVQLRGEQSGGEVSVIESGSLPGFGAPPLHHDFDETFHVIVGKLTFQLGEELFTKKTKELAFAPRGVPYTYASQSAAPTRRLIVCTPAGFERYFERMAAERRGEEPPEWALPPIPAATTVGPPYKAVANRSVSSTRRSEGPKVHSMTNVEVFNRRQGLPTRRAHPEHPKHPKEASPWRTRVPAGATDDPRCGLLESRRKRGAIL
jgi:quercetin dioxygenase-like cupin family protein